MPEYLYSLYAFQLRLQTQMKYIHGWLLIMVHHWKLRLLTAGN